MSGDFDRLEEITKVLEDRALQRLRTVLAEEARLYQELDALAELQRTAMQESAGAHARRISGAEDQWRSWLAQRRLSLNQALVTLRIRKEEIQSEARIAHARQSVTAGLARDARDQERATRRSRDEDALRALTLLSGRSGQA